jgi:hypothetical protein
MRKREAAPRTIANQIAMGHRESGEELTEFDVGMEFDSTGFGRVLPNDVGKRVWYKDWGIELESDEQRVKRIKMRGTGSKIKLKERLSFADLRARFREGVK